MNHAKPETPLERADRLIAELSGPEHSFFGGRHRMTSFFFTETGSTWQVIASIRGPKGPAK